MERKLAWFGVVCLAVGVGVFAASKPKSDSKTTVKARGMSLQVGSPMTQGNLTVFPVYPQDKRKMSSEYLTLEEALKKKVITVKEMESAEVERVSVTNKASQPIFLISGDIILGGQQDRVIARDTIVPQGAKNFVVEVFCVEHGRWEGGQHFSGGEVASGGLRLMSQASKSQAKVWEKVAEERKAMKVPAFVASTGTYRAVAQSKAAEKDINAYVQPLKAQLVKDQRAVGVVVAINGKVTAADVFADRKLFEKQLPKVLKSYALDAVQQKDAWAKMKNKPSPTAKDALALFREAERLPSRTTATEGATVNMERSGDSVSLFESAPKMSGGAAGAPAHQNLYRKK